MKEGAQREWTSRVGILLLNARLQPVHYNSEAAAVLGYPNRTRDIPSLEAILPLARLPLGSLDRPAVPVVFAFTSGRRRYVCRAFQLDAANGQGDRRSQPRVVLVLERESNTRADATRWSERFHLTNRERETVSLLLKGLTSKEIATEMNISPNTVKSFLKLAMVKVGAPNRTALIARILEQASLVAVTVSSWL
jgi:DNA-binding CsgD family transcriptional regulator